MTYIVYIIQNRNGRYVTSEGGYTSEPHKAHMFATQDMAEASACLKYEERVLPVTITVGEVS